LVSDVEKHVLNFLCIGYCPSTRFGTEQEFGVYDTNINGSSLTSINNTISLPCQYGGGVVTATCRMNQTEKQSFWSDFNFTACKMDELTNLVKVSYYNDNFLDSTNFAVKLL